MYISRLRLQYAYLIDELLFHLSHLTGQFCIKVLLNFLQILHNGNDDHQTFESKVPSVQSVSRVELLADSSQPTGRMVAVEGSHEIPYMTVTWVKTLHQRWRYVTAISSSSPSSSSSSSSMITASTLNFRIQHLPCRIRCPETTGGGGSRR